MAQQVNVEVIDEIKRVWDLGVKEKRQNEFVNIGTLDPKVDDPILVEAAGLLPRQTVKYAESVFGPGVLMVRRDLLKDTFGARQASVGDLFTGNTRWNPKVAKHFEKIAVGLFGYAGKDAFTTLVGSEQNIQDVVAGVKQTIVVKSVIVPVANMTFNMFQLLNRGVPLTTVIRGMGAKTAEINSYVKKRKREIDLEADLRAARGKKDDGAVLRIESQLQSIKDSYRRMSIWPLILSFRSVCSPRLPLVVVERTVDPERIARLADRHIPGLPHLIDKGPLARRPRTFFDSTSCEMALSKLRSDLQKAGHKLVGI